MSALDELFARTRAEGRAALVGYLPCGFPTLERSVEALLALVSAGVDLLEIGVPYTDPLMDGPVIQAAVHEALQQGSRFADVFRAVEAVASTGTPVVVMGSWNPIEQYGAARFAADLRSAGGSGAITPDLIPEEAGDWLAAAGAEGLDPVFLVAPSSTDERIGVVARTNRGFVYAASTMGVTGVRAEVGLRAEELVGRVRTQTTLPVCVGLGVSTAAQATEVAGFADGVIVGSALVRALADEGLVAMSSLAEELAGGVRAR